jgi:hypothetical protein
VQLLCRMVRHDDLYVAIFFERERYDDMLLVRANDGGSATLLVGIVKGDCCDVPHLIAKYSAI